MKRQGELMIVKVKDFDIPEEGSKKEYMQNIKKQEHRILAEGETTGHKHELSLGVLYKETSPSWRRGLADLYFKVPQKKVATLTHPDHKPLTFDEGLYKVITQREYEEEGARRVRD